MVDYIVVFALLLMGSCSLWKVQYYESEISCTCMRMCSSFTKSEKFNCTCMYSELYPVESLPLAKLALHRNILLHSLKVFGDKHFETYGLINNIYV